MEHILRLNNEPFNSIKNGEKTIEMRLFDEKRQKLKLGDNIKFINRTTEEELVVNIIGLNKFKDFAELYNNYNKVELGYKESENAKPSDMEEYYSKEEQEKYGVLAIKIQLQTTKKVVDADLTFNVELYTDGACSGNPGAGGWGYVLICKSKEKRMSGFEDNTTNNRMELTAVIEGVKAIKKPCNLTIYTDSAYVHNAFTQGWIENWQQNDFKNAQKKPVANKELWLELIRLLNTHKQVDWVKVKGHADNYYNNICDKLATDEIKMHKQII